MTNKKFNANKCTETEMNREIKRLQSKKCRAKTEEEKAAAQAEVDKLNEVKAKRFKSSKQKSYLTYTTAEINALDLETTVKGIKSLQSTRCLYPGRKEEVLKVEAIYQAHRQNLLDRAKLAELQSKLS